MNKDIAWFYLAESTYNMGYPEAAKKYYKQALSAKYHCSKCYGHVFPEKILSGISKSEEAIKKKHIDREKSKIRPYKKPQNNSVPVLLD